MSGKFTIDREIFDNPIWRRPIEFRLFFYIVGNAVWKEEGIDNRGVHVGRGQYLRSYRNLRQDLMYVEENTEKYYGLATIKRAVDELIKDGRITKKDTVCGTLFTVVNYELYQQFGAIVEEENKKARNGKEEIGKTSPGTPSEHLEAESLQGVEKSEEGGVGTGSERGRNTSEDSNTLIAEGLDFEQRNNKKNKNNKRINTTPKFEKGSTEYDLANYLYEKILLDDDRFKKPNLEKWAEDIDKLIRLDKRTPEEINMVIDFAKQDEFWNPNIMSTSKLRKQFPQLLIKAKQKGFIPKSKTNTALKGYLAGSNKFV